MPNEIEIPLSIKKGGQTPSYSSKEAAGADLFAAIEETILLYPGESVLVPTNIQMEIPEGFEVQIRPRSGLALKNKVTVLNTPGTIDSDFRGIIGVILINHGKEVFTIEPKMRIAQMVLSAVCRAIFTLKEQLVSTTRGEGGFGHTGIF